MTSFLILIILTYINEYFEHLLIWTYKKIQLYFRSFQKLIYQIP